jgi:hypothetical protein
MLLPLQVDWTLATDLLIDLFFMADIALNFNTGFICDQARLYWAAAVLLCSPHLLPTIIKFLLPWQSRLGILQ